MKSAQSFLFPVEDLPRRSAGKKALHQFMRIQGIVTHGMTEVGKGEEKVKWVAVKVPHKRLDDGKPMKNGMRLSEMFAYFGRLLDEGGWTGYGTTERAAVEEVCKERGIEFKL